MATLVASAPTVEQRAAASKGLAVLFVALAAYAALLAIGVMHHEPWADEAQAWQLVRDLPLRQLLVHQLHYEGHPSLWYLTLSLLQRLDLSYTGMRWAVAVIALAATALLLFKSPFPVWVRCALAFTFFLSFQYAIVARDYSLAPLLFFILAATWRRTNALSTALMLGLLANLALHCFAASIGFAALYAVELWKGERRPTHLRAAVVLLAGMYLLAALTVAPRPADLSFLHTSLHHSFVAASGRWLAGSAVYAICAIGKPWQLALPMSCLFAWSLWRMREWRYILPAVSVALSSGLFFNFWHLGIVELTCISAAWIAWPLHLRSRRAGIGALAAFVVFLALQLAWAAHAFVYDYSQPYSADRATSQFLRPYVVAKVPMAVTYVNTSYDDAQADPAEAESLSYFHSVGLYPYFSGPLFLNEHLTYWTWSIHDHADANLRVALESRPSLVVAIYYDRKYRPFDPARDLRRPRLRDLTARGYVLTHTFCGAKPENLAEREHICDLIFQLP